MRQPRLICKPVEAEAARSHLARFRDQLRRTRGLALDDWPTLSRWCSEHFRDFWLELLHFCAPLTSGQPEPVCEGDSVEQARFFPQLQLNYAENLLRERDAEPSDRIVLSTLNERGEMTRHTRAELRTQVMSLAAALSGLGLDRHSRVAALANNDAASVVACLGSAAIGASWSSVSPGMGADSVLSRFGPLAPQLLFAHSHMSYQGQHRELGAMIGELLQALPSVRTLVLMDDGPCEPPAGVQLLRLSQLVTGPAQRPFERLPFDHPLFVLFSSGTTGAPKCIVHGHGGTLLEHLKELLLHSNLAPEDRLLFITGTGWMMWNWQLSALATGAEVLLYEGSVTHPQPDSLLRHVAAQEVTVLGLSPAYLRLLDDTQVLVDTPLRWPRLRAILSTGSILYDDQYDFVERVFGPLPLQSISGGSDILGCFVLGNPMLPVFRGEAQCVSLGLDVRARDGGVDHATGTGELVCVRPFPSRPVGLYGDAGGERFHQAYFAQNQGVWTHGDLIELTPRGSARILGRSDGILNIRGIRIGPAEIYGIVGRIPEVAEAMAVDQSAPTVAGGRKLVLLLVLQPGCTLDRPLGLRIKRLLRDQVGMNHVPELLLQVAELPQTFNGKRSERAVQDLLNGRRPRNLAAIRNPEALKALLAFAELDIAADLLD